MTKTSGNRPCTTEALPVRSAIAAPSPPKAIAESVTNTIISTAPTTPSSIWAPKISPRAMNQTAEKTPRAAVPTSRPRTIANREIGAASRRSVKPISMSTARAMPPLLAASRVDWIIAPASMKSRKPLTCGNPGRSTARPAPPVWIASSRVGKMTIGASSCGRRKVWRTERRPAPRSPAGWRPAAGSLRRPLLARLGLVGVVGPQVVSGLGDEDVVEVGWTRSSDSTRIPASSRALTTGATSAAPRSSSTRMAPSLAGSSFPMRETISSARSRLAADANLEVRQPDLGLERGRRALGDDLAGVDDPDPVGELVGLLQVLGGEEDGGALVVELRDLLPDRLARDGVEARGRLVEEQHPRLVHQRRGEVEAPLHAARVGADAAVGGRLEVDALQQLVRALRRPPPRASRAASPAAGSARARSSAGPARPPAGRRRSPGAPCRPRRRRRGRRPGRCRRSGAAASSASAPWSSCRPRWGRGRRRSRPRRPPDPRRRRRARPQRRRARDLVTSIASTRGIYRRHVRRRQGALSYGS